VDLLLDTHALLWWLSDDAALTKPVRRAISATKNVVYVSAASAWEIATKVRLGKLPNSVDLASDFAGLLERELFKTLPISAEHAGRAGLLIAASNAHAKIAEGKISGSASTLCRVASRYTSYQIRRTL
jgi:PIN domain nuclease of toxin-antitoxin system